MIGREYDAIEAVLVEYLFIFMACVLFSLFYLQYIGITVFMCLIDVEVPRHIT